jgi:CBS domain-containing protein
MTIAELMTKDVQVCTPQDTLQRAAQIMWDHDCGSVPVVDDGDRVIGLITDRDVCMAALFRGQPLHQCSVGEVMSRPAITCTAQDSTEAAQDTMRAHQIRRLPVVEGNGRITGILSLNDLAVAAPRPRDQKRGMRPEAVAMTLAAVSQHRTPDGPNGEVQTPAGNDGQ